MNEAWNELRRNVNLAHMAITDIHEEANPEVRAQLAGTAKASLAEAERLLAVVAPPQGQRRAA